MATHGGSSPVSLPTDLQSAEIVEPHGSVPAPDDQGECPPPVDSYTAVVKYRSLIRGSILSRSLES